MKIDVSTLLYKETGATEEITYPPEEIELNGKCAQVSGQAKLTKLEDEILLQLKLEAKIPQTCSRCLEEFTEKRYLEINQIYKPKRQDEEDLLISQNKIDPSLSIRENIIAETPIKILCRPNCKGICPGCGVNLNKEKCKCKE